MPFDSTPVETATPEQLRIDRILEAFGPNGEGWIQFHSSVGNRKCLTWALSTMATQTERDMVVKIVTGRRKGDNIVRFNDKSDNIVRFNDGATTFDEIREVLLTARHLLGRTAPPVETRARSWLLSFFLGWPRMK